MGQLQKKKNNNYKAIMASTLTQLKFDEDIEFYFTEDFDMNALKCIEIEAEMIEDLHNGKLEIRGDLDDETVLVSSTKSYKIRQCDSSNTILLTSTNHMDGMVNAENMENDLDGMNMDNCNESIYS